MVGVPYHLIAVQQLEMSFRILTLVDRRSVMNFSEQGVAEKNISKKNPIKMKQVLAHGKSCHQLCKTLSQSYSLLPQFYCHSPILYYHSSSFYYSITVLSSTITHFYSLLSKITQTEKSTPFQAFVSFPAYSAVLPIFSHGANAFLTFLNGALNSGKCLHKTSFIDPFCTHSMPWRV